MAWAPVPPPPAAVAPQYAYGQGGGTGGGGGGGGGLTMGTPVAATSGTSIDFTGIPAGTKEITLTLAAMSTSGTSVPIVQIGDSGGIETAGYGGSAFAGVSGASPSGVALSDGFAIYSVTASNQLSGAITLRLVDASTNTWACVGQVYTALGAYTNVAGSKALSGTLDRIRLTTQGGVNTFDGGIVNIHYQ